jgi:hypothetical protein
MYNITILHNTTAAAANMHLHGPRNGGNHGGGGDTASISDALGLRDQANSQSNSVGSGGEQPDLGNERLFFTETNNWLLKLAIETSCFT